MGQLQLTGALTAGPPGAGESFPASSFTVPLQLKKQGFGVATGVLTAVLNSVGAFVALQGVGTGAPVTKGEFLYLRADSQIDVRITFDDGSGGNVVSIVSVEGLVLLEIPQLKCIKVLEAKGAGKLEYLVSGQS